MRSIIQARQRAQYNRNMPKRRKTRQEKIILQLRRRLEKQKTQIPSQEQKTQVCQEAIPSRPKPKQSKRIAHKKVDISTFSYNPALIKKDLIKTLILALTILSLEIVLYLKLR